MKGFYWAYDLNGAKVPIVKPFVIPTATAIEQGEMVLHTPGTGIAVVAGTDFDDPAMGAAINAHAANSGTEIKVSASPTAVYKHGNGNIITATGGSTTTFTVAGLLPQTDDLWIGGYIQVVTCAADSTMVGKRIKITDSTGATGVLTFAAQGAAFAAGDTARLCPGPLAIGEFGWDLDADGMNVDWDTNGGEALMLVDVDPANMLSFWMLRLHQFGNYGKAL
jgi:hypothetical protein